MINHESCTMNIRAGWFLDLVLLKNHDFVMRRPYKMQETRVAKINGFLMSKCLKPAFWLILFAWIDYQVMLHQHGRHIIHWQKPMFWDGVYVLPLLPLGFVSKQVFFSLRAFRTHLCTIFCLWTSQCYQTVTSITIAWRTLTAKAKWSADSQEQHLWSVSRSNQWFLCYKKNDSVLELRKRRIACWKLQDEW